MDAPGEAVASSPAAVAEPAAAATAEPGCESVTAPRVWPRVVGRLVGERPGPTLVCVAGLHGNEPAGLAALERVFASLGEGDGELRGEFLGLAGNLSALGRGKRFLEEDLNRMWLEPRVSSLRGAAAGSIEESELQQVDRQLEQARAGARGTVYALDLHTISGPGPAFVVLDDTLLNRRFAMQFPVPMVFGLEEELGGTLSHYLTAQGVVPLGFEAGQHRDPLSIERAEDGIWIALEAAGVLPAGSRPEPAAARRRLSDQSRGLPAVVEVRHRHAVAPEDEFQIRRGVESFQPVKKGDEVARDRRGPVRAPQTGLLLMPLYQRLGDDGFFLVRPVRRFWLRLSERLRPLRLERFLHWLPGVRRHPEHAGAFIVDQRIARWEALQLFHLMGFRRRAAADRHLVMARRRQGSG